VDVFLLTIINRLDCATSKNKMCDWVKNTILPDLIQFDAKKLNSKNYWYVTDDVISEEETVKNRAVKKGAAEEDIFSGLNDEIFANIERELFAKLRPHFCDNMDTLIFDTTNFFTFFESEEYSDLAQVGHNKDSRHNLKQVGLAMAIDKVAGIPFFHRVYRGNRHDALVFSKVIKILIDNVKSSFPNLKDLVLVIDKGNNSEKNFKELDGTIEWVGSLAPSQHTELLELPLQEYDQQINGNKVFCCRKNVMGKIRLLVMVYNCKLAEKQEHSMQNGIMKLTSNLKEKYTSYKQKPTSLVKGLENILIESRHKDCVNVKFADSELIITANDLALAKRRKTFGKNLLFTSKIDATADWVIAQYKDRNDIEDTFRTLKNVELIRIRPIRHFTDSKIRAHIFCCVMSFLLIRLMQLKVEEAGMTMSPCVLRDELSDLQQVIMIYANNDAEMKISQCSTVQQKLFNLFQLKKIETLLTIHNC